MISLEHLHSVSSHWAVPDGLANEKCSTLGLLKYVTFVPILMTDDPTRWFQGETTMPHSLFLGRFSMW